MISAMKTRSLLTAMMFAAFTATGALAADKVTVPSEAPVAASEVPEGAIVVNIDKMKYDNTDLKVKVGDTVVWINQEVMPHNVDFKAGVVGENELKGPMLKKGESFSITFNEAGVYDYYCTPHPFMRGKVTVE